MTPQQEILLDILGGDFMNNPIMQMMQFARNGGNPMQFLQQMGGQNPIAANLFQAMQGKNTSQLREMANNLAKERGTTVDEVAQQLGIRIPR